MQPLAPEQFEAMKEAVRESAERAGFHYRIGLHSDPDHAAHYERGWREGAQLMLADLMRRLGDKGQLAELRAIWDEAFEAGLARGQEAIDRPPRPAADGQSPPS